VCIFGSVEGSLELMAAMMALGFQDWLLGVIRQLSSPRIAFTAALGSIVATILVLTADFLGNTGDLYSKDSTEIYSLLSLAYPDLRSSPGALEVIEYGLSLLASFVKNFTGVQINTLIFVFSFSLSGATVGLFAFLQETVAHCYSYLHRHLTTMILELITPIPDAKDSDQTSGTQKLLTRYLLTKSAAFKTSFSDIASALLTMLLLVIGWKILWSAL